MVIRAWAIAVFVAACSDAAIAHDYSTYGSCNNTVLATTPVDAFLPIAPTYTMRITPVPAQPSAEPPAVSGANMQIWRLPCADGASVIAVRVTPDAQFPSSDALGLKYYIYQANAPRRAAQLNSYVSDISGPTTGTLLFPALFVSSPLPLRIDGDPDSAFTIQAYDASNNLRGLINLPALSAGTSGFIPQIGLWWNPAEPGTGYALDIKHGVLVVSVFSYTTAGEPLWYLASGQVVNNSFTATVDRYGGGPCLSCAFTQTTLRGNDGIITITFTSTTTASVVLPGGRTIAIVPLAF